jgi:hypothetical protein
MTHQEPAGERAGQQDEGNDDDQNGFYRFVHKVLLITNDSRMQNIMFGLSWDELFVEEV